MKTAEFFKDFIELCNKHNIPIDKDTLQIEVEPEIKESYVRKGGVSLLREEVIANTCIIRFKNTTKRTFYEREI